MQRATTLVAVVVAIALLVPTLGDLDARRRAADRSNERGAANWLAEVLPELPEGSLVVSWWSTSTPLWYAQHVLGQRPDIAIVDDRTMLDQKLGRAPDVIDANLGVRPVYAIRIERTATSAELQRQFDMTLVASGGNIGVWRVNGLLVTS